MTVAAATQTRPDLVVESPGLSDSTLGTGDSVTLSVTVRNGGDGNSAATTLRYYRSTDSTISTSDTQVGTDSVSALSSSDTESESISVTAPSSSGTYYYGACVDSVTDESDTTNNCSSGVEAQVQSIGNYDMTVISFYVRDGYQKVEPGESVRLNYTVKNEGTGRSNARALVFYRSTDSTITAGDTNVGGDQIPELNSSQSRTGSERVTAPSSIGIYYYGACFNTADPNELNTQNNCSDGGRVEVKHLYPDLVVESPTVDDSTLEGGDRFRLDVTVRNQGDEESPSTTLRYYRSTDSTISTSDTEVDTDSVSSLDPSESDDEYERLTAPDAAGTYYYGACVDSVTDESNTNNNCSSAVTVTVQ